MKNLAIFDLDNTLIGGDSDYSWGEFMVEQGLVDSETYEKANDQFYQDYLNGGLDIQEYLSFALAPLAKFEPEELEALHQKFMVEKIEPIMLPKAKALLEKHRAQGDYLLIITATNSFITHPIAKVLGVDDILASDAEVIDGRYTGKPTGTPCFREGKIERLDAWLEQNPMSLENSYFYSDSFNDIPLLEEVVNPVAVDPDDKLREHAEKQAWDVVSFR